MMDTNVISHPGVSDLQLFAKNNDRHSIIEMIRSGSHDINNRCFAMDFGEETVYGMSALHVAVAMDNIGMAELLLESGANVNRLTKPNGRFAPTDKRNINDKWRVKFTPLHMAVINDNEDICQLLIKFKADVNACDHRNRTPIEYSLKNERMFNLLVRSGADYQGLHFQSKPLIFEAMRERNLFIVDFLAKQQTSAVYYNEDSPIEYAMDFFPNSVPILISRLRQLHSANSVTGDQPIHKAVRKRNHEWVGLLLKEYCDPNAWDKNRERPLHIAVRNSCSKQMALTLIGKGADPYATNYSGVSPVMLAVQMGDAVLTETFMSVDNRLSRNMAELVRGIQYRRFNTTAIILRQYDKLDNSLTFGTNRDSLIWFFVKQCVGEKNNDKENLEAMADCMRQLADKSPASVVNSVDKLWGTLMHFLIYANTCCPSECYKPMFTALIQSANCDINQEFEPTETEINGELISVDRIMANGSALSFALESSDSEYFSEELIRMGADFNAIKWTEIYFAPNKVQSFKLLVSVGCTFPDDFRQYADPCLDGSVPDYEFEEYTTRFDQFMDWWNDQRSGESSPRPLKELVRQAVRKSLTSLGLRRLDSEDSKIFGPDFHPLPSTLTKFILYKTF